MSFLFDESYLEMHSRYKWSDAVLCLYKYSKAT
jgi:hypothetical protein